MVGVTKLTKGAQKVMRDFLLAVTWLRSLRTFTVYCLTIPVGSEKEISDEYRMSRIVYILSFVFGGTCY